MSKKMLINATLPEEDRVAIVEDGILTELDIETAGHQQTKGNIYKGEVIRVEQGLQAAFIDYGAQRPGFLQIGEIHPSLYPQRDDDEEQKHRRPAITEILKRGQQILVQVVKEERGTKGAALTTEISLPGRYMVLIPQSSSRGISRKIDNDQVRKQIKHTLSSLELPDNMGYIIRTAAIDQPPEELKRDFDYLLNTYNSIVDHNEKAKAPALIYQESNLVLRSIRDYFTPEIDEVLIDDREVFQQARDFFKAVMPEYVNLVKLHQERRPIFARYQIEEQISQLSSNTVALPSGGSIVLDQTEALVAIDVNSGKMGGEQDVEATAHRVNLEAAIEVARQLRLRDMGGLIVIDFIDMRQRRNAREVEKALKNALKIDKARVTVGRISHQFGLLEMSRQRIKANLGEGSYHVCPHCQGSGRIRSEESRSIALLRRIQAGTAKGHIESVVCTAALDTANYLLNNKRRELYDLEQRYKLTIDIKGDAGYLPEQLDIDFIKQTRDQRQTDQRDLGPLVDTDLSERANIEVTLPEPSDAEHDEAKDSQTEEHNEEAPRKSSRRRRRSNRRRNDRNRKVDETGEEGSQPSQQTSETDQDSAQQPKSAPSADSAAQTQDQAAEAAPSTAEPVAEKSPAEASPQAETTREAESSQPSRKPSRRRSPRKKTTPVETEQTEQVSAAGAATAESDAGQTQSPPSTTPESTQGEADAKPKRRPGRRTTKAASPSTAAPEDSTTTDEKDEEPKPAARRRRTTRKTSTQSKVVAEGAATSETPASPSEDTEEKPAPKKRAPRRKAAVKEDAAATTAEPNQDAPGETRSDQPEDQPAKKPTRRRRSTTKKAESATDSNAAPEEVTTEDAAKKKTPRKRATTKKASEETATAKEESGDSTEKKPTRRRRTTSKTAAEKTADESVEKPKRTTRRKKTPEDAHETPAEKPKRRAPRKKKEEPATPSETVKE